MTGNLDNFIIGIEFFFRFFLDIIFWCRKSFREHLICFVNTPADPHPVPKRAETSRVEFIHVRARV